MKLPPEDDDSRPTEPSANWAPTRNVAGDEVLQARASRLDARLGAFRECKRDCNAFMLSYHRGMLIGAAIAGVAMSLGLLLVSMLAK